MMGYAPALTCTWEMDEWLIGCITGVIGVVLGFSIGWTLKKPWWPGNLTFDSHNINITFDHLGPRFYIIIIKEDLICISQGYDRNGWMGA